MTKHREDLHFNEENINTHHSTFTILGACNTDNSTDHKNDKAETTTKKIKITKHPIKTSQ